MLTGVLFSCVLSCRFFNHCFIYFFYTMSILTWIGYRPTILKLPCLMWLREKVFMGFQPVLISLLPLLKTCMWTLPQCLGGGGGIYPIYLTDILFRGYYLYCHVMLTCARLPHYLLGNNDFLTKSFSFEKHITPWESYNRTQFFITVSLHCLFINSFFLLYIQTISPTHFGILL